MLQELPGLAAELNIELSENATIDEIGLAVISLKDKVVDTVEQNSTLLEQNTTLQTTLVETKGQLDVAQSALTQTQVQLEQQSSLVGALVEIINQSATAANVEISDNPVETLSTTTTKQNQEVAALQAQFNDLKKSLDNIAQRLGVEVGQTPEQTLSNVEKHTAEATVQVNVLTNLNRQANTERAQAEKERQDALNERDVFEAEAHQAKAAQVVQATQLKRLSTWVEVDTAILGGKIQDLNEILSDISSNAKDQKVKDLAQKAGEVIKPNKDHESLTSVFIQTKMSVDKNSPQSKEFNERFQEIRSKDEKYFGPVDAIFDRIKQEKIQEEQQKKQSNLKQSQSPQQDEAPSQTHKH